MWAPEFIKPYVDLLTWQVIVLVGGVFFAPAIYMIAFRLQTLSMGPLTAGLSQREARTIANEVEQQGEDEAAEEPEAARQAAEELSSLTAEEGLDKPGMYKDIVQAWSNLSVIVRDLAAKHGGQKSLKAFLANLDVVSRHQLLEREEIERLRELHHRRFQLGTKPTLLTTQTYRAYLRRARRTANRLKGKLGLAARGLAPVSGSPAHPVH